MVIFTICIFGDRFTSMTARLWMVADGEYVGFQNNCACNLSKFAAAVPVRTIIDGFLSLPISPAELAFFIWPHPSDEEWLCRMYRV
jgi:hypothetical protein